MPKEVFATTPKVTVTRDPIKGPSPPQRVTIYARDGSPYDVYQIDAKEIVTGGEYFFEPPVPLAEPEPDLVVSEVEVPQPRRGRRPKQVDTAEAKDGEVNVL